MNYESKMYCPDCDDGSEIAHSINRRDFVRRFGMGTAAALASAASPKAFTAESGATGTPKPAESLIRDLHDSLSAEQKAKLILPWNHQGKDGQLSRLGAYNSPFNGNRIGDAYNKDQQELIRKALRSILSGDESFERLSRNGEWDSSGSFEGCGATIFGDPSGDKEFAWLFTGHHLTLRCDGNSMPGAAFGGPIYYGHRAPGYEKKNVFYYQTQQVQAVFDSLDAAQQKQAMTSQNPGDGAKGIKLPNTDTPRPGISYRDLSAVQKALVEKVMRTLLDPFRSEDANEVMEIVKANGGMDQIYLSFTRDKDSKDENVRWHFWRLEGPGFIWNYRPLPHVHCFVNIANLPPATGVA